MPELTVEVSIDSYRLAQGAARTEAFESVDQVVDAALQVLFEEHEDLRLAAIAREFERRPMTKGRARDLAGPEYRPGEMRDVLTEYGVDPEAFGSVDPEDFRESLKAARRAFGSDDESDEVDEQVADDPDSSEHAPERDDDG